MGPSYYSSSSCCFQMPFGCRKLTTSTSARVTGHSRNSVTRGDCHAIWWNTRINPAKASQIHANSEVERTVSAFEGTSSYFLCILRELAFFWQHCLGRTKDRKVTQQRLQ